MKQQPGVYPVNPGYLSGVEVGMFYWADVGMKMPQGRTHEFET